MWRQKRYGLQFPVYEGVVELTAVVPIIGCPLD